MIDTVVSNETSVRQTGGELAALLNWLPKITSTMRNMARHCNLRLSFLLLKNADDLLFAEPAALHIRLLKTGDGLYIKLLGIQGTRSRVLTDQAPIPAIIRALKQYITRPNKVAGAKTTRSSIS